MYRFLQNRQKPTRNKLDIPLFLPSFSNRGLEIAQFPEIRGIFDSKNESRSDFFFSFQKDCFSSKAKILRTFEHFPFEKKSCKKELNGLKSVPVLLLNEKLCGANCAGSLVFASALALLCALDVPTASADPFTTRDPDKDFNTLGLAGQNKNPLGICAVEISTNKYMLVSDARDKQIFAYDLATKARVDSHHPPHDSRNDDFTLHPDNQNPVGIWANSTTSNLWVVDAEDKKIYSYSLYLTNITWAQTNKSETTLITTNALKGSFRPDDGTTQQKNNQITLDAANDDPTGLWADDTYIYVANEGPDKIFAYKRTLGVGETEANRRVPSKEFDLEGETGEGETLEEQGNTFPQGIWSDGETMWVSDFKGIRTNQNKKIFAYKLELEEGETEANRRVPSKDFNTLLAAGNERPRGIWSDGETMWVADKIDNKIYAYHGFRKTHDRNPNEDFDTLKAASNRSARGIWSDGEIMWATDNSFDKLFAYNLATKEREIGKEFTLKTSETDDKFPQGLWSDGTTMWVSSFNRNSSELSPTDWTAMSANRGDDDVGIYAYKLADGSRDTSKDFTKAKLVDSNSKYKGNDRPLGIWSDGTTMWVVEKDDYSGATNKIYAYNLTTKARVSNQDFNTLHDAENRNPSGLWSDGTTMWVTDSSDAKIYAYKMSDKSRDASKDFDTLENAGNNDPFGIWSDNITTMWVLDSTDDKIYAYNTDAKARLGRLVLKGLVPSPGEDDLEVKLSPEFNNGTMNYKASVPYATERLTLETKALRPIDDSSPGGISYSRIGAVRNDDLEDVDDDKDDFQVDLTVGMNSFAITVTNGNTNSLPRSRTYRVNVTREFFTFNDPSKDIDLDSANADPRGVWANEETLWVANDGDTVNKLYAYNLQTKLRDTSKDFNTLETARNRAPSGIWSDGATMWVADTVFTNAMGKKRLFAYKMSDGTRDDGPDGEDIDLDSANAYPEWIWSDGVTMWVSDSADNKLYAYDLVTKAYDSNKDVSLAGRASRNTSPTGMWADGASLWIADNGTGKIYAHKINETGDAIDCWEEVRDFNTLEAAGNLNPAAIFSDRSTMYVVDADDDKVYAYNQPLSTNNKLKSLDLSGVYYHDQDFSQHFSSNETNYTNGVYVIYAASFTTVAAVAQEPDARVEVTKPVGGDADSNAAGYQVALPLGENTDIEITVTAENGAQKKYSVTILQENGGRTPIRDIYNADFDTIDPAGLFGEGTTFYVVDKVQKKIYAYNWTSDELTGKDKLEIASSSGFNNLASANMKPWGIWANSETMWVTDEGNHPGSGGEVSKIFAYHKGGIKAHNASKDIEFSPARTNLKGLWSDGTILYAAGAGRIYAFNVANGTANSARSFNLDSNNGNSLGIWSDGTTMWVANGDIVDDRNIKIYAYNMWTNNPAGNPVWDGSPDSAKDINNLKETLDLKPSSNSKAAEFNGGLWSDGITIWVSVVHRHRDTRGKRLYAFNLPQTPPPSDDVGTESESEDSTLKDLRLSGVTLSPVFSPEKTYYTAQVAHDVASTTVTASPNDSAATVEIYWANQPGSSRRTANRGAQVTLEEGYNIIVLDVEAENGFVETYFVEVTKAEAPPVSGGPLPVFQSASVGNNPTADSANSSDGLETEESRLIFAETLADGGIRFVFLVPSGEFQMEETADLLGETWRLLPEDEFQSTRESLGAGSDRLTIILPKAAGKQRFLRLSPQR